MLSLLLACSDPTSPTEPSPPTDVAPTDGEDTGTTPPTAPTGDTGATGAEHSGGGHTGAATPEGVLVLAGGGSEGDVGDAAAWSARLYRELLSGGDVSGDGRISVAVLADAPQTAWLPEYFVSLGADEAFNLTLDSRRAADDPTLVARLAEVDALFLKGGDQGVYYDLWNDRLVEQEIRRVREAGGGVGGTSAGAMSLAGVALAGGEDLVSSDVLADACTPYLDDRSDGGSGLHEDFFGFLEGAIVDTHVTVRGRLGRMVGALAKGVADGTPARYVVGLDERTGLVVRDGRATVVGVGAVTLVVPGATPPERVCGEPLVWTGLRLDALVDGWSFDPATLEVTPGPTAEPVSWAGPAVANVVGEWYVDGDLPRHEERFALVVERAPDRYAARAGTDLPVQQEVVGVLDAHDADRRGAAQEAVLRAIADFPGVTGFVVGYGGSVERAAGERDVLRFVDNPKRAGPEEATMVVVSAGLGWRGSSPEPSNLDVGNTLFAAGLTPLELHVLADTPRTGARFDTYRRAIVR